LSYFSNIPDPRKECNLTYKLEHIFFIILSAMLAGANSINQISVFGKVKAQWIKNLIAIDSIPSYGIFWWILVRIKPEFLRQLLGTWLETLPEGLKDQVLAIDGKCLRGTQNSATLNSPLHLVSLFAVERGIILAQQPVKDKSNEITAIPKILEQIDIQGAVITTDAMGCQTDIAKRICDRGADYVLALKGNAGHIYDEIVLYFKEAEEAGHKYLEHTFSFEKDFDHGRIVSRMVRCVQDVEWLPQFDRWEKLKGIIEVISKREERGKNSMERRYYITSLDATGERLGKVIKGHWGIENHLHRQLDVNFVEDSSVVNTGYASENLATFRRLALNMLGSGKGLLERRKKAGWDESYLTEVIMKFFIKSF
ncbi:H repeat-associated protein YdcC, partial [Chlamydiales bacterium STE3]